MTISKDKLRRIKAGYALATVPPSLRSDLLADGELATACSLTLERPIVLTPTVTVEFEEIVTAFRRVADGDNDVRLRNKRGRPIKASLAIQNDGSMLIEIGRQRLRFEYASLLAADKRRRLQAFDKFADRMTLASADHDKARATVLKSVLSAKAFVDIVDLLTGAPESFFDALRLKAEQGKLNQADFIPPHQQYWDALLPAPRESRTLDEYGRRELHEEWRRRFDASPEAAVHSLARTFAAPLMVPTDFLRERDLDQVASAIESLHLTADPMSQTGMFEICAVFAAEGSRFIELGERVLKHLLADIDDLENQGRIYAAMFVVTTAYLAEHEVLRNRPIYWRRLAAAAHAALIVPAFQDVRVKHSDIVPWSLRVAGQPYVLSVLNEFRLHPNWRPDWIDPRHLVSDILGRVISITENTDGKAGTQWVPLVEVGRAWLDRHAMGFAMFLPALLEGERKTPRRELPDEGVLRVAYDNFIAKPNAANFLPLTDVLVTFQIPPEAYTAFRAVVAALTPEEFLEDGKHINRVLATMSQLAARDEEASLAALIADTCIDMFDHDAEPTPDILWRLLECAGAYPEQEEKREFLVSRIERLAFSAYGRNHAPELLGFIQTLRGVDEKLSVLLARAHAAARLARPI